MKEQRGNYLTVAGVKPFHNGDGVCFLDEQGRLQGFRINRVDGNKLYPAGDVPRIKPRTRLFRNFDQEFERILARKSAERKIGVGWELADTPSGFALTAADEDGNRITLSFPYPKNLRVLRNRRTCAPNSANWGILLSRSCLSAARTAPRQQQLPPLQSTCRRTGSYPPR